MRERLQLLSGTRRLVWPMIMMIIMINIIIDYIVNVDIIIIIIIIIIISSSIVCHGEIYMLSI